MGSFEQGKWSNGSGKNGATVFETDAEVTTKSACGTMNQRRKTEIVVCESKQSKNATYRSTVVQPRLLCCEFADGDKTGGGC
jgi:hypothetical protein